MVQYGIHQSKVSFLAKPFTPKILVQKIRSILGPRPRHRLKPAMFPPRPQRRRGRRAWRRRVRTRREDLGIHRGFLRPPLRMGGACRPDRPSRGPRRQRLSVRPQGGFAPSPRLAASLSGGLAQALRRTGLAREAAAAWTWCPAWPRAFPSTILRRRLPALLNKFRLPEPGLPHRCLLMDDIPAVASRPIAARPSAPWARPMAAAPAPMARSGRLVRNAACGSAPRSTPISSPPGPIGKDPYLLDLRGRPCPRRLPLMWTGPRIIAGGLGRPGHRRRFPGMFRGNVLLWDNLYANDYCPNKIFLGPYRGAAAGDVDPDPGRASQSHRPAADGLVPARSARGHSGQGESPAPAWREGPRAGIPAEFRAVAPFLDSPFFRPRPEDLAPGGWRRCTRP